MSNYSYNLVHPKPSSKVIKPSKSIILEMPLNLTRTESLDVQRIYEEVFRGTLDDLGRYEGSVEN